MVPPYREGPAQNYAQKRRNTAQKIHDVKRATGNFAKTGETANAYYASTHCSPAGAKAITE
eukprot:11207724-Lingulodinium_polyedra.AAC.1